MVDQDSLPILRMAVDVVRMVGPLSSFYRACGASREGSSTPPAGPPVLYSSPARAEPDAVGQDVMLKRIEGLSLEKDKRRRLFSTPLAVRQNWFCEDQTCRTSKLYFVTT